MFLAFRGSSFGTYFIFTAAVLCRVAAVKRLPESHHSADYIFWSFRIIVLILSQFENRVLLKPVLGGGARAVLHNYITAHERTQLKRVCYFRFFAVFFAFRGSLLRTYFLGRFRKKRIYCYAIKDKTFL